MNLILDEVCLLTIMLWIRLKYWSMRLRPVSWSILRPMVVNSLHMHSKESSSLEFFSSDSMHECMMRSVRKSSLNSSPMNLLLPKDFFFDLFSSSSRFSKASLFSFSCSWKTTAVVNQEKLTSTRAACAVKELETE